MIPFASLGKLYAASREHAQVEDRILELLQEHLEEPYVGPPPRRPGPVGYVQRNFFSILFLSLYRSLGIPTERRLFYGVLNHCVRGIVTGADNILDEEYKELLPLRFSPEATKFRSIMHILLFDRFLSATLGRTGAALGFAPDDLERVQHEIFRALVPIGAGEAQEESGVEHILKPAELLSTVHMYKGGKLLCLSLVAPRVLETQRCPALALAERGVYAVGVALQVVDDLTDFYTDLRARRHNYLISSIWHEGPGTERRHLEGALADRCADGPAIEKAYPIAVRRVTARAVEHALAGFDRLAEAGFWLDRKAARPLIRYLFQLRGVEALLPFFPEEGAPPDAVVEPPPGEGPKSDSEVQDTPKSRAGGRKT